MGLSLQGGRQQGQPQGAWEGSEASPSAACPRPSNRHASLSHLTVKWKLSLFDTTQQVLVELGPPPQQEGWA